LGMRRVAGVLTIALATAACGENNRAAPSAPGITLRVPNPVVGRYVTCDTCTDPTLTVVAEFTVTVGDPYGPGGNVAALEVRVFNRSRDAELARNTHPNSTVDLPGSSIPASGEVQLNAGIGLPAPPPRDEVVVTVMVTLTDGRQTSRTVPLTIEAAAVLFESRPFAANG
jgi:hypothetical protein